MVMDGFLDGVRDGEMEECDEGLGGGMVEGMVLLTFVGLGERAGGCPCFAIYKISKLLTFFCLEE